MAAPDSEVPQTESIADVYATDSAVPTTIAPDHKVRWNAMITQFKMLYGGLPDFVARSPGRVNIIGEHIDYSLYDVLPTAIDVDVLVAVKVLRPEGREASVKIANANPDKFPARQFGIPCEGDVEIDTNKHEWINYFKSGLLVALKFLRSRTQDAQFVPASIDALVDGNVPPGAGISSSAALVCASALAVVKANKLDISKQDLLDMAIVSERAVGVYSGG
jgi:galactokinase